MGEARIPGTRLAWRDLPLWLGATAVMMTRWHAATAAELIEATFGGAPGGPWVRPSEGWVTPASSPRIASTSWALSSGLRMSTGEPEPASKCLARSSWPETESTLVRKMSDWATPLTLSVGRKAAATSRPATIPPR